MSCKFSEWRSFTSLNLFLCFIVFDSNVNKIYFLISFSENLLLVKEYSFCKEGKHIQKSTVTSPSSPNHKNLCQSQSPYVLPYTKVGWNLLLGNIKGGKTQTLAK